MRLRRISGDPDSQRKLEVDGVVPLRSTDFANSVVIAAVWGRRSAKVIVSTLCSSQVSARGTSPRGGVAQVITSIPKTTSLLTTGTPAAGRRAKPRGRGSESAIHDAYGARSPIENRGGDAHRAAIDAQ